MAAATEYTAAALLLILVCEKKAQNYNPSKSIEEMHNATQWLYRCNAMWDPGVNLTLKQEPPTYEIYCDWITLGQQNSWVARDVIIFLKSKTQDPPKLLSLSGMRGDKFMSV